MVSFGETDGDTNLSVKETGPVGTLLHYFFFLGRRESRSFAVLVPLFGGSSCPFLNLQALLMLLAVLGCSGCYSKKYHKLDVV